MRIHKKKSKKDKIVKKKVYDFTTRTRDVLFYLSFWSKTETPVVVVVVVGERDIVVIICDVSCTGKKVYFVNYGHIYARLRLNIILIYPPPSPETRGKIKKNGRNIKVFCKKKK